MKHGGIGMTSQRTRMRMVERLRGQGIRDELVLATLGEVPRHLFVEEALASRAYEDIALPLGFGQTISSPYTVARMTELARAGGALERVLEIGTGCGYQAAILSRLCRHVYTIERHKPLLKEAAARFAKLGFDNITAIAADGSRGWPEPRTFDRIIVTAAASEMPRPVVDQLAEGGRMILPLGGILCDQRLVLLERGADGIDRRDLLPVRFVPLISRPPKP